MKEAPWNMWLRDKLLDAFMAVFDSVFAHDPSNKLQYRWINYLPPETKDITDEFFVQMIGKLFNRLSNYACLISAHNRWHKPEELVIPGAEENLGCVYLLFTSYLLTSHCRLLGCSQIR